MYFEPWLKFHVSDIIFLLIISNLERLAPAKAHKAQIQLLGSYDSDQSFGGIITDPYHVRVIAVLWKLNLEQIIVCGSD